MINDGMMTSNSNEWETPQDLFDKLNAVFQFDLDVCATDENTKCGQWYTKEQDGLAHEWMDFENKSAWMNPPYGSGITDWLKKAYSENLKGMTVVCLLPARTDTKWFHEWVVGKAEITFLQGRLKFGGCENSAPFPSMIAVYRPPLNLRGWTV
jgi:phage N-6-adenine-methyltransferase